MAEEKPGWSDQDRRILLITVGGTLMANLATVVIVFGSLALIKDVETCSVPPSDLSPGMGCTRHGWVPVWPLVWGITAGVVVAVGLIVLARWVRRRFQPGGTAAQPVLPPPLSSRLWPRWLRGRLLSIQACERIRMVALAAQCAAVVYMLGVVIMWVGLASGLQTA